MYGAFSTHGKGEKYVRNLFETSEGKRPLGRPRRRWEGNVRMDLTEIRWEAVDWVHLAEGRDQWRAHANTVMNLRAPYKVGNFLTTW